VFARVTTFEGPDEAIDGGLELFRQEVLPWLSEATGFRGWVVLRDRAAEKAMGITFWLTEEAMQDEDASGATLRDEVAARFGATMKSLEFYEVALAEGISLDEV
jgi:hypothetical protein